MFWLVLANDPVAHYEEAVPGHKETGIGTVVSAKGLAKQYKFPDLEAFGRIETHRETDGKV